MSLYRWVLLGICFIMDASLLAQDVASATQPFKSGSVFPENFLTTKVAVILEVPATHTDEGPMWQQLADQLHEVFRSNAIDAVAYYRWEDLSAGPDASKGFMTDIEARSIKNLIVFKHTSSNPQDFQLMVTPFNPEINFYDSQQVTWGGSDSVLESLLQRFAFDLSQSGLKKENFLINELPEFFIDTKIFRNRRFESYNPDLKLDKLAVPRNTMEGDSLNMLDRQTQAIMQQYPFNYELADYKKGEELLRSAGFQFVLLRLHSSGEALQVLLDYPASDVDSLQSIKRSPEGAFSKSVPKGQTVFKYYIKHIYTGDVYLGDQWDADPNWSVALENHLLNLRAALKVKQN